MIRKASALSDQVIKDQRVVTVTGKIVGDYGTRAGHVLMIEVGRDAEVEVGPK